MWEYHTVEAYSNWGRTMVLYAVEFRSLLWIRMFLLIKPSVWFASFEVLFICVLHESSDIVTPRYLANGTISSSMPCRRYLVGIGVLSRVAWMTWHFEVLEFMSQSFYQSSRLVRSCWRISDSKSEVIAIHSSIVCKQSYSGFDLVREVYARNNIWVQEQNPTGHKMRPDTVWIYPV